MKDVENIKLNITIYDAGYVNTESILRNAIYKKAAAIGYDFAKDRFFSKEFKSTRQVFAEVQKLSDCGLNVMLNHTDDGYMLWVDHNKF